MRQALAYTSSAASERDRWGTPPELFAALHAEFGFGLDAAADAVTALLPNWIGIEEDALKVEWGPRVLPGRHAVFCNPPYSRLGGGLRRWMQRCKRQARRWGLTVVVLVPAAIGSTWWAWTHHRAPFIRLAQKRLKHRDPATGRQRGGSSFGSAVVIFTPRGTGPAVYSMMEV